MNVSKYVAMRKWEKATKPDGFLGQSSIWRRQFAEESVVLAQPETFMNSSGIAVADLMRILQLSLQRLIVVFDDVALPWGSLRIRLKGSAGGHNGLKSILHAVDSDEFVRVRIGVQPSHPVGDLSTYVLNPLSNRLRKEAQAVIDFAAEAVEDIVKDGPVWAMAKFNNKSLPI